MKNCVDEGTLQAWFDGELAAEKSAKVAAHVSACAECAAAAAEVESENLILSEALSSEYSAPVPTAALRQRLDSAIAALEYQKVSTAKSSRWTLFAELFSFRPLAYASAAAIVLVAIIGFVYLKNHQTTSVAKNNPATAVRPESPQESPKPAPKQTLEQENQEVPKPFYIADKRVPKRVTKSKVGEPDANSLAWQQRQYENAIARLNDALKTQPPMRPALQVDYEYNMAVIDSAIKTTRDAAKKNPKDPLANQFMLAAYQSKVDFMNQIADARGLER